MALNGLLEFIEAQCPEAWKPVDLTCLSDASLRSVRPRSRFGTKGMANTRLLLDVDTCLNRMYGGVYHDWVSGGEWNTMMEYLTRFFNACVKSDLEIIVFFNGALERNRFSDWCERQIKDRRIVVDIIKHIKTKGTHPHKALWYAPAGIKSILRLALRDMGVTIAASFDDHHQDLMAFVKEHGLNGVISSNADLILMNPSPPRYFSSYQLKLKYNGTILTEELNIDEFAKKIDLDPQRFCLFATLLGTHILSEDDLKAFYSQICGVSTYAHISKLPSTHKIRAIINFVRDLQSIENLDQVADAVFRNESRNVDRVQRFKSSVEYFKLIKLKFSTEASLSSSSSSSISRLQSDNLDISHPDEACRRKQTDKEKEDHEFRRCIETDFESNLFQNISKPQTFDYVLPLDVYQKTEEMEIKNKCSSVYWSAGGYGNTSSFSGLRFNLPTSFSSSSLELEPLLTWWQVSPTILGIAKEQHQMGHMMSWVYQLLTHGEIFLPVALEDESDLKTFRVCDLFRPIRQKVYSFLLLRDPTKILGDHFSCKVKEWSFVQSATGLMSQSTDVDVIPEQSYFGQSRLLQRMWMGENHVDIILRMDTFIDCFECRPISKDLLNMQEIKMQYFILCCILRYMLVQKTKMVINDYEVDAFLATAVSSMLCNTRAVQELNLTTISMRGIQLATAFMTGVEHAMFVNDAVGIPIPNEFLSPSKYFDGRLFLYKLEKVTRDSPLRELCEGSIEEQMHVENMHRIIFHSLPSDCAYLCRSFGSTCDTAMTTTWQSNHPSNNISSGGPPDVRAGMPEIGSLPVRGNMKNLSAISNSKRHPVSRDPFAKQSQYGYFKSQRPAQLNNPFAMQSICVLSLAQPQRRIVRESGRARRSGGRHQLDGGRGGHSRGRGRHYGHFASGRGGQPGFMPGVESGVQPGVGCGGQLGVMPGVQPGVGCGGQPGVMPGVGRGAQPGVGCGAQPGVEHGVQPCVVRGGQPDVMPGVQRGVQPGVGRGGQSSVMPGIGCIGQPGSGGSGRGEPGIDSLLISQLQLPAPPLMSGCHGRNQKQFDTAIGRGRGSMMEIRETVADCAMFDIPEFTWSFARGRGQSTLQNNLTFVGRHQEEDAGRMENVIAGRGYIEKVKMSDLTTVLPPLVGENIDSNQFDDSPQDIMLNTIIKSETVQDTTDDAYYKQHRDIPKLVSVEDVPQFYEDMPQLVEVTNQFPDLNIDNDD